jgi:hypothetical protein
MTKVNFDAATNKEAQRGRPGASRRAWRKFTPASALPKRLGGFEFSLTARQTDVAQTGLIEVLCVLQEPDTGGWVRGYSASTRALPELFSAAAPAVRHVPV